MPALAAAPPDAGRIQVWRFGDSPAQSVNLTTARRFV
jgi:hypothetical protein